MRVAIVGVLQGTLWPRSLAVDVHDVSENGLAVESPEPLATGATYRLELSGPSGTVEIEGTVVHCLRLNQLDGRVRYLLGLLVTNPMKMPEVVARVAPDVLQPTA